ncbi:hypothetical protein KQX54_005717 [Cotesia glomerata]|uniref:Uncharacterized protein n=1 Tax=Cotesia glomerata TaxID=32391 RepID=A0AAV7IIT9_COTGL|nr:hypothetical protein KQX54_005717 [Cotesia glomerata]
MARGKINYNIIQGKQSEELNERIAKIDESREVEHCALIDVSNPGRIVSCRDKWGQSEEAKHTLLLSDLLIEGNLER